VQTLLIQQAQGHFAEGRYEASARLLRRLLDSYPRSTREAEVRWWLGRSYEQAGRYKQALAEYRLLASLPPHPEARPATYGTDAKMRRAALEQRLGLLAQAPKGLVGLHVSPRTLPDAVTIDQWMQGVAQAGITLLVLDVGTKASEPSPGVYFKTAWATSTRDVFGYAVRAAHQRGLAVFASVSLRRMPWLDTRLGWNDMTLDRATGRLITSTELNLFHPAYQEYLVGFLADLSMTGIDGVLFRAESPSGPMEGFSAHALRGFERDFSIKLDPTTLAIPSESVWRVAPMNNGQPIRPEGVPDYWRWLGWKARETVATLARLRQAVQQRAPVLQFALEVHREAVSDPLAALFRYSEDVLEAKAARFEFYLTADGPPPMPFVTVPPPGTAPTVVRSASTFAGRALELIGEADDLWLAKTLPTGDSARPWVRVTPGTDRASLAPGMGLLYLETPLDGS